MDLAYTPSAEEAARRERARRVYLKELTRAKRLNAGLNAAIRRGDPELIKYWQKLMLPFYNIPYYEWKVSQREN